MNRSKANQILEIYEKPVVEIGQTELICVRLTEQNIQEIEDLSDDELISQWKSNVSFKGSSSFGVLQRSNLLELELISRRNIDLSKLDGWYRDL